MKLVFIAALVAVCGAAKLDRTYLPPASAKTAGGGFGDLLTPIVRESFQPGQNGLPKGAEENEFDGVVVEAATPGTRASSGGGSGLGGPRISYGSTHSKVGEAAFKIQSHHQKPDHGYQNEGAADQLDYQTSQNFHRGAPSEFIRQRPQSAIERTSSTVRFENNIGSQAYSYGYETENGIVAGENGVAINGIQAEGGYSYTGDDGKLYKITYTAGDGGYQPVGDHLPTPPPIPDEILKSLEQNAKDDAAGLVDDGSYDATKYNVEDDYTKSDSSYSRKPAFGKKPELDFDANGPFINQNNRPYGLSTHRHREQQSSIGDHFISSHTVSGSNEFVKLQTSNSGPKNSETNIFAPTQNAQTGGDATFINTGSSESDKKVESNTQNDEFGLDDFSRPINFGSTHFNQFANNGFGVKPSNLSSLNNFAQNHFTVIQSNTAPSMQSELSSKTGSKGILMSSNFALENTNNINQEKVNIQNRPQNSPNGDKFTSTVEFNENTYVSVPKIETSNTFSGIHSTLQPSLELSTPFEYYMNSNQDGNLNYQNKNERGLPLPTIQPLLTQVASDSLTNNVAHSVFTTSNNNVNLELHQNNSHPNSNYFQQLPFKKEKDLNVNFQYNARPDNLYYYNQPSVLFNPYSVPNTQLLSPSKKGNMFLSSVSTKYPSPPTVQTIISSSIPEKTKFSQHSQVSSFKSPNEGLGAPTKYPQPPSVGQIIPAPTSPTEQSGKTYFALHAGITQASASPFPTTSPSKYDSNYNFQQIESVSQNLSPSLQSNNVQGETNIQAERVEAQAQNVPDFDTVSSQTRPIQQYDGEVYEYKKPMQTLSTPTESDEPVPQNDFTQFGQKLKPSFIQTDTPQLNQKQNLIQNSNDAQSNGFTSSLQSLIGAKPLFEPQRSQSEFSSQSNLDSINKGFDDSNRQALVPTNNVHSTSVEQSTQSSSFPSGAFPEVQTTTDYKAPFGFSSRIRPCCQGPRKSSIGQTPEHVNKNGFQNSALFGQQNTNLKPGFQSGSHFGLQPTGLEKESESAHTTSQSFFTAKGEEFNGLRRQPSFDEASGYHY